MDETPPALPSEPPAHGLSATGATGAARARPGFNMPALGRPLSEDDDLRSSLALLSRLATGRMELADVLTRVAEYAVAAIPGADGAGLTLIEAGRSDTVVASAPFVAQVDAIQYGINEGPCITAASEGRTMRSGALSSDRQWPRFGPRVGRLGVHSALSLPLMTAEGVLGAMNVYAHAPDAFDDRASRLGELFSVPAAIAVQNAQVLAHAKQLARQLETALTHRAVIDQAKGILISRIGCGPDEAFERLRQMSQSENQKLHTLAQRVVDEAMRRARAQHTRPST
jgi:hypothetical protein